MFEIAIVGVWKVPEWMSFPDGMQYKALQRVHLIRKLRQLRSDIKNSHHLLWNLLLL
jgi:hypothetical protein